MRTKKHLKTLNFPKQSWSDTRLTISRVHLFSDLKLVRWGSLKKPMKSKGCLHKEQFKLAKQMKFEIARLDTGKQ
jgi:hypothetical protein